MNSFALDIGGAFIKHTLLSPRGKARRGMTVFELWKEPERLASVLKALRPAKPYRTAITMTGELCDCFKNRAEGVRHIVGAARWALGEVAVFAVDGSLLTPSRAMAEYSRVASANWAAVPVWLAKPSSDFLLVDIGSTTTDFTPVWKGKVANCGHDDFERLRHGELLYTGCLRTAVPAVVSSVKLRGGMVPLSAETFAIMGDVHLILGNIGGREYRSPAPDGGPKTFRGAARRLARCVLADEGELSKPETISLARQVAAVQAGRITSAAERFGLPVVVIGTGAFILDPAFKKGVLNKHRLMGDPRVATADPSLALAYMIKGRFCGSAI